MILLSGARQCGKTTYSKWLINHHDTGVYLNWDQIKDRKKIIQQDWDEDAAIVVLDEIHKKKLWKTFLKGIFDTKKPNMRLLVTGSARMEYFQKSGDSMFGRYRSWRLHPFCMSEDPLHLSLKDRFNRLLERGGFPYPYLAKKPEEVARWRNQHWTLLLREDLRDLESIRNIQSLELMAELLKSHAAGMLSFANLAEDVEISPKTAKTWVSVLEKLYLITRIQPYTGSLKRVLSKTPKIYFFDTGDLIEQPIGARVENLVAINLIKRLNFIEDAFGDRLGLHYLRDKEGREVDFVITLNRKPVALIEVKTSYQSPDSSLIYFRKKLGSLTAVQLHAEHDRRGITKQGVRILSIHEFFSGPLENRRFWDLRIPAN